MKKNSFYKKMMMSVAGAALVSVGLNQSPNNAFNRGVTDVSAAKKTKKAKTVGANSAVYQKKGKKMVKTKKTIKVGKKVHVYAKKTVKGKTYYKIGKNQYIKAANVNGKTRKAGKKTVLYTRSGKVIKNRKVRKGQKIKVYGGVVTIKGKKYYSTKYGYIKVSALAKKAPVVKPNNDTSDNTSTPTTTKPVENNSNGSNGSTAGSNSNGSNAANSSASNSSSSGSTSVPTGNDSSSNNTGSNGSSSNGGSSNGSGSTGSSSNNTNSNSSDNNNSNGSDSNSSDNNSSNSSGSNSSDNNDSNDSEEKYRNDFITLPEGYTKENFEKALKNELAPKYGKYSISSSSEWALLADKGFAENEFVPESKKDDEEKVDLKKVTFEQEKEISSFIVRLINSFRVQWGLPKVTTDEKIQEYADDYTKNIENKIKPGHVFEVDPGFYEGWPIRQDDVDKIKSMTDLKKLYYTHIKTVIFGESYFNLTERDSRAFDSLAYLSDLYYSTDDINKGTEKLKRVAVSFAADPADYGTTEEEKRGQSLYLATTIYITENMIDEAHSKGIDW